MIHVVPAIGTFVPSGSPLLRVEGDDGRRLDREAAIRALGSGLERTLEEDVAYGFRMLVDMGERALSDSPFLDPTTAVQALDRLHDGLRQLVRRQFPDGRFYDSNGLLRLTVPVMDWDAYVHLVFDEIRIAGRRSPQVTRRLMAAFDDLLEIAPPTRRAAIEEQSHLLRAGLDDDTGGRRGPGLRHDPRRPRDRRRGQRRRLHAHTRNAQIARGDARGVAAIPSSQLAGASRSAR